MGTRLRNESEVQRFLIGGAGTASGPISEAMDYVLQKITERARDRIEVVVYERYTPVVYERSGQFLEAWDKFLEAKTNKVQIGFGHDPEMMDYNPSLGQHGTPDNDLMGYGNDGYYQYLSDVYGDFRDALADVIFGGNKNQKLFPRGTWTKKRDAWTPIIRTVESKIYQWFREGCERAGLKVKVK